jgi:hypothetical protein
MQSNTLGADVLRRYGRAIDPTLAEPIALLMI